MIKLFVDDIKDCLSLIPVIGENWHGLVRDYRKRNGNNTLIFPVNCNASYDECEAGPLNGVVPSPDKKALFYLDQIGDFSPFSRTGKSSKTILYSGRMVLVGWINTKLLGNENCNEACLIAANILKVLEGKRKGIVSDVPFLHTTYIKDIRASSRDPFNRFSSELYDCFKLFPYDFFALDFLLEVHFRAECLPDYIEGEPNIC